MEKYDIFIQAGQSNADGYGHGPAECPNVPDERILYYTAGTPEACDYHPSSECTVQIAAERPKEGADPEDRLGDFSLSFAQKYVEAGLLAEDRKLVIVRTAVGGTGFLKHYWQVGDPLYDRMLQMTDEVLNSNPENRLMGLLWHQGEHDSCAELIDSYEEKFLQFYHDLMADIGENVPFLMGGVPMAEYSDDPDRRYYAAILNKKLLAIAEKTPGIYFVSSKGLECNPDFLHINAASQRMFGERYYKVFATRQNLMDEDITL